MSIKYCHHCCKADHNDDECWSTHADNGPARHRTPVMPIDVLREPGGMHKLTLPQLCRDPAHLMPSHLHIPGGHKFVHYCPSCQFKTVAFGVVTEC
jgi:hypothetical protein